MNFNRTNGGVMLKFSMHYFVETEDQIYSKQFKNWFGDWENDSDNASKVVDKNGKPLVVYHGTNKDFDTFDRQYSAQGVHWFSSDRDKISRGDSGAASSSKIISVYLNLRKLAGWNEYDKKGLGEIEDMGYNGILLDDDYIVFDEKNIKSATANKGTFNPKKKNIKEDDNIYSYPVQDPPDYSDRDYKARGGVLIHTTPDMFLSKVHKLELDDSSEENVEELMNFIKNNTPIDPAIVYIDNGIIINHDGRHRALASKKLNIDKFPVIVIDNDHTKLNKSLDFSSLRKQIRKN